MNINKENHPERFKSCSLPTINKMDNTNRMIWKNVRTPFKDSTSKGPPVAYRIRVGAIEMTFNISNRIKYGCRFKRPSALKYLSTNDFFS